MLFCLTGPLWLPLFKCTYCTFLIPVFCQTAGPVWLPPLRRVKLIYVCTCIVTYSGMFSRLLLECWGCRLISAHHFFANEVCFSCRQFAYIYQLCFMIRLYIIIIIIIKFLSAFVVTSLWMICRPCCTFKLLAYAKLICMGYRKVVSSPCKNHGIYEYIMRYVYRSL